MQTQTQFRKKAIEQVQRINNSKVIIFTRDPQSISDHLKIIPQYYRDSDFCVTFPGDNPAAKRLFDAVHYGCIPILISDDIFFALFTNLSQLF